MAGLKRLCPACGAANSLERRNCHLCGAELQSSLPMPLGERFPVPWKEVGASLAIGAGALALRGALHLVRGLLEKKATRPVGLRDAISFPIRRRRRLAQRAEPEKPSLPQVQISFWGRRVRGWWGNDQVSQLEVEEFSWQGISTER